MCLLQINQMIQRQVLNSSNFYTSQYEFSDIRLSYPNQKNPEQQKQIMKKQNRHLLKNLCETEVNYISNLKIIHYGIKISLEMYFGSEGKELASNRLNHVIQFVKIHMEFFHSLQKMVEQYHQVNQSIFQLLDIHFKKLGCYETYINDTSNILRQLDKIIIENKKKAKQIFRSLEQPLRNYILAPINHLAYYNKFMKQYIKNLQKEDQITKKLKKTQEILQYILLFKLNMQSDSPSETIIQFLQKSFSPFQTIQVIVQLSIYIKEISYMLYVIRGSHHEVALVAVSNYNSQTPAIQFSVLVEDSMYLNLFPNTLNTKNRLGICSVEQFYMVRFEQDKNIGLLVQKFALLQNGTRFKHIIPHNSYEEITNSYHIVFNLIGIQKNRDSQNTYVLKLQNYQYSLSQYLFITIKQLQKLIDHVKKTLKISDIGGIKTNNMMSKIKGASDDFQESKWINIEEVLNSLVRDMKVRTHGEYLFHNLKIFQGMWQIMTLSKQSVQHCTCPPCMKVNFDEQNIETLLYYVEEYNQERICPKFWIKARQQLFSKLMMKSNFFNHKTSKKGFKSSEKMQLLNLKLNKIGWKIQKCIKKLPSQQKIKVLYRNIQGQLKPLYIFHTHQQQTIELIIKKICDNLNIKYHRDYNLCNYVSSNQQQLIYYDDHQFFSEVILTKPDLYFKKTYFFSDVDEEELVEQQKSHTKLHMNLGEMIYHIRSYEKIIDVDILKEYIKFFIEMLRDQKIINSNQQINEVLLKKYLNKRHHSIVNSQFIENLKNYVVMQHEQKRKSSQIYRDIVSKYNLIGEFAASYHVIYIKTSVISPKIYDNIQAIIKVDYEHLTLEVQKLGKWLKMKHNEYKIEIIGNLISLKQNNNCKDIKWIKVQNSYPFWRRIKTYQNMYKEIKLKFSSIFSKSELVQKQIIFI